MAAGEFTPTFRQFYTGNASISRRRLLDSGGFDVRYRRSEDVELAYRLAEAGLQFVFDPRAIGFHFADRSYDEWLQSARDYGANDVAFARDHGRLDVLPAVGHDFRHRHPVVRWAARACVAKRWFRPVFERTMKSTARAAEAVRMPALSQLAFSGVFNCAYYTGVADELGGPAPFRRAVVWAGADI
jgi:GT2 family glycosyltransferase